MEVKIIDKNKKQLMDLLLLADEQESMIDRYLERGTLFALYDNGLKSICVVTDEGNGIYEIKNLATYTHWQKQGYGSALVEYVFHYYKNVCRSMLVGTGDSLPTISFYEKCGFTLSHRVANFFTDHYDHPIIENGTQLIDMIYLRRDFCQQ